MQEYQGAPLFAEVTRTANSIDANTRTMLTELQIDNSAGKLILGMYVVVTFPPVPGSAGAAGDYRGRDCDSREYDDRLQRWWMERFTGCR